jgi:hypothetical protein
LIKEEEPVVKEETRHKLFIVALFCLMVCTTTLLHYKGMRLPKAPDAEDITKIIVEHTDYPGDTRKYVDTLSIDMARGLLETLRYAPVRTPEDGEPVARLTYVLDDGSEVTVEANDKTVWWKGKTYAIYNTKTGQFVKYCATYFFEDPLDPYQEYRDKYSTD